MVEGTRSRAERRHSQRRRTLVLAVGAGAAIVLITVAAVLVLSGGDDSGERATSRTKRTTTTAPESTTTTALASTSTTTTSAPPDTSVVPKSTNPVVALAQQYDGRYEGTFTNTTSSSTGPATLDLQVDPGTGDMRVKARFDGDLFGRGAGGPREIESSFKLGGDPDAALTTETAAFGPVTGKIDATLALVLTAPDVPGRDVRTFDLTGTIKPDYSGFDATYAVGFEDGQTATGTITISCASGGQRSVDQTPTLCSPL